MADSSSFTANITTSTDSTGAQAISVVQSNVIESSNVSASIYTGGKGDPGEPGPAGDPGVVQALVAGPNITIDDTDPANPIISSSAGGAVDSVNGQTGVVSLDTDDISDSGATNKYVTAAEKTKLSNLSGTNTGDQDLSGYVPTTRTVNGSALSSNITLTQDSVGDGTTYKQYSQTEKTKLAGIATAATANDTDANLKARANHTGTQTASTISDFSTAADARITAAIGSTVQAYDADLTTWGAKTAPSGTVVGTTDTQTLTNKTLTSPAITTPTGIIKGDVGLGNVDNTSDATKNAASVTLTNKTINGSNNTLSNVLTLTTTGSSGAATYNGTTLNVPQYAGVSDWGDIGGTLSDQTDLQAELDAKANMTVDDAAPVSPADGDLWWDTDDDSVPTVPGTLPIAGFMLPPSLSPYPASDITSYTMSGSAPSFTSQQTILFNDADAALRFRYSPTTFYSASGNGVNAINGMTTSSPNSWTSYEVEFFVNGDRFSVLSVNINAYTDYRIYVDDMPLDTTWALTQSSALLSNYMTIQFATSRTRRVRLLFGGGNSFTAVYIPGASDIWAAPPRYKVAMTGDSYVHGNYGSSEGPVSASAIPGELSIQTGWEVFNLGQAGTGYVNDGTTANGRDYYGASSRLSALAALPDMDLIIVFGGGNDISETTSTVVTAAETFWSALKTAHPNAGIVVAGVEPGSPVGFDVSDMDTLNTALKAAAQAHPDVAGYIDMRTDNWVVGTGYMTAPANDGNQDFLISSDGVHPSKAGSANLAYRMIQEMKRMRI